MRLNKIQSALIIGCAVFFLCNHANAQQHKGKGQKATVTKTTKTYKSPKTNKTYKSTTVKVNKPNNTTKIVSANRYPRNKVVVVKPRVVHTVKVLPVGYTQVFYGKRNYYCHSGYYYHYHNGIYRTIAPPFGFRIGFLPVGYRTVYINTLPHYYYRGVYYRQVNNEYEVVEPAVGTVVPELPENDVEVVTIDGETYYEFDDILYKPLVTKEGVQYEVVGRLDD
jgi:hypothetical protein